MVERGQRAGLGRGQARVLGELCERVVGERGDEIKGRWAEASEFWESACPFSPEPRDGHIVAGGVPGEVDVVREPAQPRGLVGGLIERFLGRDELVSDVGDDEGEVRLCLALLLFEREEALSVAADFRRVEDVLPASHAGEYTSPAAVFGSLYSDILPWSVALEQQTKRGTRRVLTPGCAAATGIPYIAASRTTRC